MTGGSLLLAPSCVVIGSSWLGWGAVVFLSDIHDQELVTERDTHRGRMHVCGQDMAKFRSSRASTCSVLHY